MENQYPSDLHPPNGNDVNLGCKYVSYRDPNTNKFNTNGEIRCYDTKPKWWPNLVNAATKLKEYPAIELTYIDYEQDIVVDGAIQQMNNFISNNYNYLKQKDLITFEDIGFDSVLVDRLDSYFASHLLLVDLMFSNQVYYPNNNYLVNYDLISLVNMYLYVKGNGILPYNGVGQVPSPFGGLDNFLVQESNYINILMPKYQYLIQHPSQTVVNITNHIAKHNLAQAKLKLPRYFLYEYINADLLGAVIN